MKDLEPKFETWKNKLLDLGKRNSLLNYRDTRRSNLRIKKPGIYDLWNSFVINEEPLIFPRVEEVAIEVNDNFDEEDFDERDVVTNQPAKEQQKTLNNIRTKAKTAIEEQGINLLYLSFGFIRWTESDNSILTYDAPIVLVPVTLKLESITSPFVLSLHEDEIVVNPTLQYKLNNDYGIKLPDFDIDNSLNDFFEEVSEIISKSHWELIPDVGLSLLSFLKINMYRDLEQHKESILNNPIIRALGGDKTELQYDLSEINDVNHDEYETPADTFQIVDADSSQQDAILCARKGISFVLQGPPGTGKSQTITNIIAECLANGKKVLFVSEKLAALEVVHKRLDKAGLADFCLILHSYKANKKDTLAQLEKVLNLSNNKAKLRDDAIEKLEQLKLNREKLNAYDKEIHTPVMPLNKTIYQVNGYLAHLHEYDEIIFSIDNIENISQQEYSRLINELKMFVKIIGNMSDSIKSNPWHGTSIDFITNELRFNIGGNLNRLLPKIQAAIKLSKDIATELSLNFNISYNGLKNVALFLSYAARSPKVPENWIIGQDITYLYDEIEDCTRVQTNFNELRQQIHTLRAKIAEYDKAPIFTSSELFVDDAQIRKYIDAVNLHIICTPIYNTWKSKDTFQKIEILFSNMKRVILDYRSCCSSILFEYEREIFNIDYNHIYPRFKTHCSSALKNLKREYKNDKRQIQCLKKNITKKIDDKDVLLVLEQLRHIEQLKDWIDMMAELLSASFPTFYNNVNTDVNILQDAINAYINIQSCLQLFCNLEETVRISKKVEKNLKIHYEYLYDGMSTNWVNVRNALDWAKKFREMAIEFSIESDYLSAVCSDSETIYKCEEYSGKISNIIDNMNPELLWFIQLFKPDERLYTIEMPVLYDRVAACENGLLLLEEWIDYHTVRKECNDLGLGDYLTKIEDLNVPAEKIIPIFEHRFYRLWLDKILPDYPAVANFRRRVHETTVNEFSALDKQQFEIAKQRIIFKLINELPSINHFTNGADEISILKRELKKQRRIMPTRKLFKEIPNLILTLKPCLMMSPLSVSLFLEANSFIFDTVIFDEASQVCTENAVGAISRGKQVVIAGDSKQLPPTNFFTATISNTEFDYDDENEDETDDFDAFESVLDEAALLPEQTLLWHYRSRHEHLITYSNQKIYGNNLITFPSNIVKVPDIGVEYIYVPDGYYDRGGRKGNIVEAEKVAKMVFIHFDKHPNRSLGVIAFGEVQQQAIEMEINQMRWKNQAYETFFNEDREEEFFIKNLENVQGDERDSIIFSIGYAKDVSGKMYMNFGPLSKSGGERRLNVAITRAKYNVKLVGSIMPTDIDIDRISANGPKLLRGYIDYAINGPSVFEKEITISDRIEHDSPFEADVYHFLENNGYELKTQVGCSGYRIDMAVKHPTLSERYVLGIECDGATYHSARTARERDRLRQSILEDMGWKIYRIWSTDWIKDKSTEGKRLLEAVNKAILEYVEEAPIPSESSEDMVATFLSIEKKETTEAQEMNPYGFNTTQVTYFPGITHNRHGLIEIEKEIEYLVQNEYPIHIELLCQKLAPLYQREKATSVVQKEVFNLLKKMRESVIRKDNFLYPVGYSEVPVRINNKRSIKHISNDELSTAMYTIAGKCIGTTREALIIETARAYGFARSGNSITIAMNAAFNQLLSDKKINEIDGKVIV